MSVLITGDTHGDLRRLGNPYVKHVAGGEFPSHVIVLGDFGLVWSTNPNDTTEGYWINWLNQKPWITLATLGNHENYERIYQLPLIDLYGGKAYKVSDKVYILQHGHIFTIEGKTFFNFGGARSIDKAYRQNRISWWQEEEPTMADFYRGCATLDANNKKVDYIITHTAPQEAIDAIQHMLPYGNLQEQDDNYFDLKRNDPAVQMFSEIAKTITWKLWLFGHFHVESAFQVAEHNYRVLYKSLICL